MNPDVRFGDFLYYEQLGLTGTIEGQLKSGIYRYYYRYITRDGYKTVFSPLTDFITVSTKSYQGSWHNYYMGESGTITNKANRLKLYNADTRFYKVEFGYLYGMTNTNPDHAAIFQTVELNPSTTGIEVTHTNSSLSNDPVDIVTLGQRFEPIIKAKTIGIKNGKFFPANTESIKPLEFSVADAKIVPTFKDMSVSEYYDPSIIVNAPYTEGTHSAYAPRIQKYIDNTSTPVYTTYNTVDEYQNYKGTLWEHLYRGFWRGETYPIGVVLRDRKGNPFFVQHIADYTFPEQFATVDSYGNTIDARLMPTPPAVGDDAVMSIMGAMINELRIPENILYDENGVLQVSGFEIVQGERLKRVLHQGLIVNTVFSSPKVDGENADEGGVNGPISDNWVSRPLPYHTNKFAVNASNDSAYTMYNPPFISPNWNDDISFYFHSYVSRPHTYTYHSPDTAIEEYLNPVSETQYLRYVGSVKASYRSLSPSATVPEKYGIWRDFIDIYGLTTQAGTLLCVFMKVLLSTLITDGRSTAHKHVCHSLRD